MAFPARAGNPGEQHRGGWRQRQRQSHHYDVSVTLQVWPRMIHAWMMWNAQLAEGRQALEQMGEFVRAGKRYFLTKTS